jgi:LAO/AO transport system kinase
VTASDLARAALRHDRRAVARLITLFERDDDQALGTRREVAEALVRAGAAARGRVIGLTGAPGAGKSTLIGALVPGLVAAFGQVAVLAVDPSSPRSGGAFLGDRVRARIPADESRVFFRSQAAGGALGGLSPRTPAVAELLTWLFELVLIETVGVGQSEMDVRDLVDGLILTVAPMGGDRLQGLKAGLMEVADLFVVTKADVGPPARRAAAELADALTASGRQVPVIQVSAKTAQNLEDILRWMGSRSPASAAALRERQERALRRAVGSRFGQLGHQMLERLLQNGTVQLAPGDLTSVDAANVVVRSQFSSVLHEK